MDEGLYKNVREYKTALVLMREMLSAGIITVSDYDILCTVLAEKYGLKSSTIFAEIDLISGCTDGNIRH